MFWHETEQVAWDTEDRKGHVGEKQRILYPKKFVLGHVSCLPASADFSIFCIVRKFTGKVQDIEYVYLTFWVTTFLSFVSYCYFQAECAPSGYDLYILCKNTVNTEDINLVN